MYLWTFVLRPLILPGHWSLLQQFIYFLIVTLIICFTNTNYLYSATKVHACNCHIMPQTNILLCVILCHIVPQRDLPLSVTVCHIVPQRSMLVRLILCHVVLHMEWTFNQGLYLSSYKSWKAMHLFLKLWKRSHEVEKKLFVNMIKDWDKFANVVPILTSLLLLLLFFLI